MFTNPGFTLGDQIFWVLELFLKTLAAEACKLRVGAVSVATWTRGRRFQQRFLALYARWKAGTLPKPRVRKNTSPRPTGSSPVAGLPQSGEGAGGAGAAGLLPRAFAWLYRMLPSSAGTLGSMLGPLLTEHPEMRAFVAEAPQAGRLLRPICTMVGLKPPEYLQLPKRVRKKREPARLSEKDEAELRRVTAWFPDTPPARRAKWALRQTFLGKPVDLTRMSAIARGYFLHPPRDRNCPPPEIGYGGRWPRLPKDYVRPKDWE